MAGVVDTWCGFKGIHRVTCTNCRTDNTWRRFDAVSFQCTRCKLKMGIALDMRKRIRYADTEEELERMLKDETN